MATSATIERELTGPPSDGVTNLTFSPYADTASLLLVSSWDSFLRVYDTQRDTLLTKFQHKSPVLDCCFGGDGATVVSSGLDGDVKVLNVQSKTETVLGNHDGKGVKNVGYSKSTNLIISGGWDSMVKFWDSRAPTALVHEAKQSGKVFGMGCEGTMLVLGTAGLGIVGYDLRNVKNPLFSKDSPLKYQTRTVEVAPHGDGYAVASVEGRIALEYMNSNPEQEKPRKNYSFKCHRQKLDGQTLVFPVNAIAYHPVYGTFASGGGDGLVSIWDGNNRKRLFQSQKYPTSISSVSFNHDGTKLAVASSYTFEEGEKDHPRDAIYIRDLSDSDVRPKHL